jgi:hypothetical protein
LTKNQVPLLEINQNDPNTTNYNDALTKWENELSKSQSISNSPPNTTQPLDTSVVLATQKIIPAHVSGMVPFGIKKNLIQIHEINTLFTLI